MANRFPNAQLSRPLPGNEQLRFLNIHSHALGGRGDVLLFSPPELETTSNIPLLILLHGVYGCQWNWWLNGSIDSTAITLMQQGALSPFMIAMPSDGLWGDGSGYVPHAHADYEKWIIEDVPECLRELFPSLDRNKCFLAGLSMGGFGALRLGMKYPQRVAGISAHSAITHVGQLSRFIPYAERDFQYAGAADSDLLHWASIHRDRLPPIRFDCGTEDPLLEANRELHRTMLESGIPHHYEELRGGHDWTYWTTNVQRTLAFCEAVRARRLT